MPDKIQPPPFDPGPHRTTPKYVWWSWHPKYPNWARSCWDGTTEAEAWAHLGAKTASLRSYYNKLILEKDGQFIEIADIEPCSDFDEWVKLARSRGLASENSQGETHAFKLVADDSDNFVVYECVHCGKTVEVKRGDPAPLNPVTFGCKG